MLPIKITIDAADSPKVVPLNNNNVDFSVSVQVIPSGGATYSVEGTLDQPQSYHPLNLFPVGSGVLSNSTVTQQDALTDPIAALIFTLDTGSLEVSILQQGLR